MLIITFEVEELINSMVAMFEISNSRNIPSRFEYAVNLSTLKESNRLWSNNLTSRAAIIKDLEGNVIDQRSNQKTTNSATDVLQGTHFTEIQNAAYVQHEQNATYENFKSSLNKNQDQLSLSKKEVQDVIGLMEEMEKEIKSKSEENDQLSKLMKDQKQKASEYEELIATQKADIREQVLKLTSQKINISVQEEKLKQQREKLAETIQLNQENNRDLEMNRAQLNAQLKRINVQKDLYNKQVSKMKNLENIAEDQVKLIKSQKTILLLSVGFAVVIIFALSMLYLNFRRTKNANQLLNTSNINLEKANSDLKATQDQLVQQEKLASLGALTAGVAHEIKNPLNFVNNFAELSGELVTELKSAQSDEERAEIMDTLQKNLEKINEHGKRADSIVKSMLEHSRSGSSDKQACNINNLCEEYLNLAYHGMRASVKNFSCVITKNLAADLPPLIIVQQDISRVILNLINNAFYAVKKKPDATFSLSTEMITGKKPGVRIRLKDNGIGIPDKIKQKIFEPFFTTKPSGEGTGLGLSLSFDIIKSHGGTLEVESKEGQGTEFIITLPA